jgi:SAM-dependent methyltransferase
MGYIFDFNDAVAYERWFNNPCNRFTLDLQNRLMLDLLRPFRGETLLDIGCGIGASTIPILDAGLQVTGLDPSPYMLDIAIKNVGNRVDLHRGFAENLPFEDNSFNYACLVTTLEFVDDPQKALEEACRVAKDRIFIGVLNRYALKGLQRRVKGIFTSTIYNRARFFSIWEIKGNIRALLGDVPVVWRTVCQFPITAGWVAAKLERIERSGLVQRCPFGTYTGMVVSLEPRFRTNPLTVTYPAKSTTGPVTG